MNRVQVVDSSTSAALRLQILLLDEHRSFRILALVAEQIFLNESKERIKIY